MHLWLEHTILYRTALQQNILTPNSISWKELILCLCAYILNVTASTCEHRYGHSYICTPM